MLALLLCAAKKWTPFLLNQLLRDGFQLMEFGHPYNFRILYIIAILTKYEDDTRIDTDYTITSATLKKPTNKKRTRAVTPSTARLLHSSVRVIYEEDESPPKNNFEFGNLIQSTNISRRKTADPTLLQNNWPKNKL